MKTQNTLNLLSKKNYLGRVITTVQRDYKGVAIETAEIGKKADSDRCTEWRTQENPHI